MEELAKRVEELERRVQHLEAVLQYQARKNKSKTGVMSLKTLLRSDKQDIVDKDLLVKFLKFL